MNDSDSPFEDAVRQGLGAWTDDVEIPDGLGSGGIRRARRRAARRAAMIGVPVVAAAAVVVAVVSGGGAAGPTLSTHPPSVPALNASAVVRKVSARVKALGPSDGVLETVARSNQQRSPLMTEWVYTDPHNGIRYDHIKNYNAHGQYNYGYWNRGSRLGANRVSNIAFEIEPLEKSYGIQKGPTRVRFSSQPGIQDTAQQIAQTLAKGHVHLAGETTIQGQKALRLALKEPRGTASLYVNANTYRPIEQVVVYTYHHGREVITDHIYLRPATPANIARAVDRPDLKGYRRR